MIYTTHGLMTPADIADHHALYDTGRNPDCPGHDESNAWGEYDGTTYCCAAESCPNEDLEPL